LQHLPSYTLTLPLKTQKAMLPSSITGQQQHYKTNIPQSTPSQNPTTGTPPSRRSKQQSKNSTRKVLKSNTNPLYTRNSSPKNVNTKNNISKNSKKQNPKRFETSLLAQHHGVNPTNLLCIPNGNPTYLSLLNL